MSNDAQLADKKDPVISMITGSFLSGDRRDRAAERLKARSRIHRLSPTQCNR